MQQFESTVGCVVDIATPSKGKLRALGFLWALIALFPLLIINYLIIDTLSSAAPLVTNKPTYFFGALLMPLIGWFSLGSAVQRFRAASTEGRYFRSGPGGISVRVPDDYTSSTFLFSFKILKFDLPWDQIKTWYPFVESMNGIPTDRSLVFETLKNEKIKIKTYHFAEKQKQITANIFRSKSIVADAPLAASVGPPASERPLSLPPSATELSLQIKKKRDLIKEIDLRAVAKGQRGASIERTAELLEAEIVSLCPRTAGYRCSRKRYRPFKEWRDIFGIRLFVRRGLFDGYEIQVEPKDSECRQLSISICASNLISDLRRYASMALAAVFVMISLKWSYVVQYWLGDFAELTPLVMLAIFVGAVGISTGLLQLPIHLLRLLMSDQQRAEAQKQGIKIGIQKMTI